MKICLLTNYDLPAALALEYLIPTLSAHDTHVFHTRKPIRTNNEKLAQLAHFEQSALKEQGRAFSTLESQELNDINTQGFERFAATQPDVVISIRHMSILKSHVIELPKHGVINLHSGLLPNYQGVMASFWAMKFKEPKIGSTLHFIEDSSIDTGSVIAKSYTETRYDKSYLWNALSLYRAGCQTISSSLHTLSNHKPLPREPQTGNSSYFSYPNDTEIASFEPPLFEADDSLAEFLKHKT